MSSLVSHHTDQAGSWTLWHLHSCKGKGISFTHISGPQVLCSEHF